jgi:hypothetical protein
VALNNNRSLSRYLFQPEFYDYRDFMFQHHDNCEDWKQTAAHLYITILERQYQGPVLLGHLMQKIDSLKFLMTELT